MKWFILVAAACVASLPIPASAKPAQSSTQQGSSQLPARSVAITYDDLPFVYDSSEEPTSIRARAMKASRQIQQAHLRFRAPATGFVNEFKLRELDKEGIAILRSWNSGIFELANHSFSHADSNKLTLAEIEQEVVRGEQVTRPLAEGAGRTLQFYRFPYNHVGDTEEKRAQIESMLMRHGYRLAASTIDTSDYIFNRAYERALAQKDRAMRRRIEAAYLDYTRDQAVFYSDLSERVHGYRPPEIIVLHLNSINAATAGAMLKIFMQLNFRFVTLAEAQSDPAYQRSPATATRFGPMWQYRWASERGVKVDGRLEQEPPQWVADYGADK
jgi:peptidoglycan/xylan/chitin deacetylase (PgdA/CDA1 family)